MTSHSLMREREAMPLPFVFTNTHLLVQEFDYAEPATAAEAAAILAREGDRARLLAGGTDLLVQMKMERHQPTTLVSLAHVPGLSDVTEADGLTLGATATIRTVAHHPAVRARATALAEACRAFSTVQIMEMGTIGGNVCNASPAADAAPALLVLDAVAHLTSPAGSRTLPLAAFFAGPGRTALAPAELLESIHLPVAGAATGSAFLKVGRVAADIAKVCVAVRLTREGGRIGVCRIALGAVAPTPLRAPAAEALLTGERLTTSSIAAAVEQAQAAITPITDVRSTAAYRRQVAGVLVADALRLAWQRAGGEAIV